ncbi:cro/C1-type HTH DNA-binding domain protein, partial [Chlamydia psittaci 01DC11]
RKNFAQEIKVFLNKYQITQKELSLRLHLSIKHINSILNNEIKRISASVLDNLEYVLKLPFGSLTRLYHEHIALNE